MKQRSRRFGSSGNGLNEVRGTRYEVRNAKYELRNTRYWEAIDVLDSGCLVFLELGERKKEYIDCYLSKLEKSFKSIRLANLDSVVCESLAKECAAEMFPAASLSE